MLREKWLSRRRGLVSRIRGRVVGVFVVVAIAGLWSAGSAWAAGRRVCMGGPGTALTTPASNGRCSSGSRPITLAIQSEVTSLQRQVAALQAKLSKVSYSASGLNGKPTVKISGANLQVVNGSGSTSAPVNGLGNLIIGYDENPGNQIGSHNLLLGNHQSFTTWGGIIGGAYNTLSGAASAVFGSHNNAAGSASSITGGEYNIATDFYASITGGCENLAGLGNPLSGPCSPAGLESVSGGEANTTTGLGSSISGGYANAATASDASILGGVGNTLNAKCATLPDSGQSCP
jgi:hypothetical protein